MNVLVKPIGIIISYVVIHDTFSDAFNQVLEVRMIIFLEIYVYLSSC